MRSFILSLATALLASAALGDQLVLTGQVKEGTFQGFDNGRFQFATAKGRFMKEQAGRVTKLALDKPQKVSYVTSDGKKEEAVELKGYEKRAFTFSKKGAADVKVPQMKMKTIELLFEGGEGEGDAGGGRYPIPAVDLNSLAGADITPGQQAVIDEFVKAKKVFDDYFAESAAMVAAMDKATGTKREDYLNKLRQRKNDEQPLRKALLAAYNAIADAFPEPAEEPAAKPVPAASSKTPANGKH